MQSTQLAHNSAHRSRTTTATSTRTSTMPKKGGKKGKGSKVAFSKDADKLAPYGCSGEDIIVTPLGVEATVLGVNEKDGLLWLQWPGKITSPLPTKAKSKADMEKYGYYRKGGWAIIQRSIDSRALQEFNHKFYGAPPPKTAAMKLPTPKPLFEGWAIPAANRPQTANF